MSVKRYTITTNRSVKRAFLHFPAPPPFFFITEWMISFEWDHIKEAFNRKKHGVSFQEAQSVFYDEFAVQFFDEEHSTHEQRFFIVGDEYRAKTVAHLPL